MGFSSGDHDCGLWHPIHYSINLLFEKVWTSVEESRGNHICWHIHRSNSKGCSSCRKCRQNAHVSLPCIQDIPNKTSPIILEDTFMKKWINMMCTRIVLIQKVTAVVVKNSTSHKPSLIAYQQSGDICSITDMLSKKPLTIHCPNGLIMLLQMLYLLRVTEMDTVNCSPYDRKGNVHLSSHAVNSPSESNPLQLKSLPLNMHFSFEDTHNTGLQKNIIFLSQVLK
jgi:hypothetical protein